MGIGLAWMLLAALDGGDPAGTVVLQIEAGKTAPIVAKPGSNVICDDPSVATGEFSEDGQSFVVRGHKPGTTLCGVWVGNQVPGGLYRVKVAAAKKLQQEKEAGGH